MNKQFKYKLIYAFLDFISAFIAWVIFYNYRKVLLGEPFEEFSILLFERASFIAVLWTFLSFLNGVYSGDVFRKSRLKETTKLLKLSFFWVVVVFFVILLDDEGIVNYTLYYKTFTWFFVIHFLGTFLFKMIFITRLHSLVNNGKISFNTLIIGSGKNAHTILEELGVSNKHLGLKIKGFVHVFEEMSNGNGLSKKINHFGDFELLPRLKEELELEEVIIAVEPSEHKKIEEILIILDDLDLRIRIITDLYQILIGSVKVNNLLGTPLIEIERNLMPVWQRYLKRILDVVISAFVLIIGSLGYAIVAVMVKFSSKGGVFYKQERIGVNKKPFKIIKFRSMYEDAESGGPALSSKNDSRITPWGRFMRKTRIDEMPQFWNVLVGEMSIVGPRPERQFYVDQIMEKAPYYKHLQKVKPGITSYGMVKFGYAENVDEMVERLKYDILYIENMSLAMDFRVLLYTILIVLQRKGK